MTLKSKLYQSNDKIVWPRTTTGRWLATLWQPCGPWLPSWWACTFSLGMWRHRTPTNFTLLPCKNCVWPSIICYLASEYFTWPVEISLGDKVKCKRYFHWPSEKLHHNSWPSTLPLLPCEIFHWPPKIFLLPSSFFWHDFRAIFGLWNLISVAPQNRLSEKGA